jgi:hypothetical protein
MTPPDDPFPVLDVSDDDTFNLRPKESKGLSIGQSRLIKLGFLAFHGMMLATFLNFVGIARVPGLEWFTKARLMPARSEPLQPLHPAAPAKKPARPAN